MKKAKSKNRLVKNRRSKNNRLKKNRSKGNRRKNRQTACKQPQRILPNGQAEIVQSNVKIGNEQLSEETESVQPKKKSGKVIAGRIFTAVCIALCVLLIPLFAINLILTVKGYVNPDEVPSLFSVSPMYVMTDSMVPTIDGGDLIFVKKVPAEEIAVDDIIAFFDPESMEGLMIVHRVKEISTDGEGNVSFRTKGDANNVYDTFIISGENVVGRCIFRIRGLGRVAMFMQSTYGLIITASIPLIVLFGYEFVRQIVHYKREREEE